MPFLAILQGEGLRVAALNGTLSGLWLVVNDNGSASRRDIGTERIHCYGIASRFFVFDYRAII